MGQAAYRGQTWSLAAAKALRSAAQHSEKADQVFSGG
jgi:hypothetical protein